MADDYVGKALPKTLPFKRPVATVQANTAWPEPDMTKMKPDPFAVATGQASYKPAYMSGLLTLTGAELLKLDLPPRELLLSPWLPAKGLSMLHAERGIGKEPQVGQLGRLGQSGRLGHMGQRRPAGAKPTKNGRPLSNTTAARLDHGLRGLPACTPRSLLRTCRGGGGSSSLTTAEHSWTAVGPPRPKRWAGARQTCSAATGTSHSCASIGWACCGSGDDTDAWAGKQLVLFSALVDFRGDSVEAIRVKVPPHWLSGCLFASALVLAVYHLEWDALNENYLTEEPRLVLPLYVTLRPYVVQEDDLPGAKRGETIQIFVRHGIYIRSSRNVFQGVVLGAFLPLVLVGVAGFIAFGRGRPGQ
jgi:hypothetical protein